MCFKRRPMEAPLGKRKAPTNLCVKNNRLALALAALAIEIASDAAAVVAAKDDQQSARSLASQTRFAGAEVSQTSELARFISLAEFPQAPKRAPDVLSVGLGGQKGAQWPPGRPLAFSQNKSSPKVGRQKSLSRLPAANTLPAP